MRRFGIIFLLIAILGIQRGTAVPPEAIQDLRWRLMGPLRAGWSICAEGIPDEPDTFYFGGADGGVWKTIDSGTTWQPISDHAPFSSVGALAISLGTSRVIYVGSGHVDTRYDVMDGTGVYKSEDDGKTWTSLGLSETGHIGRILIDPHNRNVLVVAALGHLFGPSAERGVFRSEDGGRSWEKVLFVDENTGAVDLASDPATPEVIYAAMWQVRQYPWQSYFTPQIGLGSGIWKSQDGGKHWTQTLRKSLPAGPLSRIGLAVAPKTKGERVYASVFAQKDAGLYRSDDGGASWQLMNSDGELASTYFARLTADPENPDIVYSMGRSLHRSEDGGKNFTIIKGAPGGDDYHFMWINPKHPDHIILAADQGTTVTVNGGKSWSPWYNQATGQFYHLAADNRFPYWVYSGQQDSGTVAVASRSDYGQLTFRDWHPVGGDERDYNLPDPDHPQFVYSSGLGGRLSLWDQETGRVTNVSPTPVPNYAKRPTTVKYRYTWITPIAISSRPSHAIYQGAQVLFRSPNKAKSWQIISPDLTGTDPNAKNCEGDLPIERATACGYGVIFAIAPSAIADGLIWIGTDNGRIQLTRDEGRNWINVTPPAITDWSKIAAIDASPTNAASAYVAVDRHRLNDRRPYIYRTEDYGKTWTLITTGIPENSWVNVVRQDPDRPGLLYAGTRTGVFVSFNDGEEWQSLQLNLPRSGVNDLLVHGKDLIAATQGRAIWVLDDLTPLRHFDLRAAGAALVPPATAIRLAENENRDTPLPPEVPTTPNPPVGAIIDYYLPQHFDGPVVLEILDDQGAVVRSFRSDKKPDRPNAERYFAERWLQPLTPLPARSGHNRFVWNLRTSQPKVPQYDFSIAAVPGQDTPTVPRGMLILPGRYTVRLTAAGKSLTQPLNVVPDPRAHIEGRDLQAQFDFYRDVTSTIESILEKYGAAQKLDAAKRDNAKALIDTVDGLVSIIVDLENADGPPTVAQRQYYVESKKILKAAEPDK